MKQLFYFFAAILFVGCSAPSRHSDCVAGYPLAEWNKATEILMHTPGQELFDCICHPSAGLFDNYFDVDKAAEEHRGYIRMLEANGIRVHTVSDILSEVALDTLRALVKPLWNICNREDFKSYL